MVDEESAEISCKKAKMDSTEEVGKHDDDCCDDNDNSDHNLNSNDEDNSEDGKLSTEKSNTSEVRLPQKKYYRQRAHSNPISDHLVYCPDCPADVNWAEYYPKYFNGTKKDGDKQVEFLDIGCGYGGLLVELSPMFPDTLMLGMEIRVKVSQYVIDKIKALRELHSGAYQNIACIRANAMRYLSNFFQQGQLTKIFFLYPDPHFKKSKHKWRIVNDVMLTEYSYILAEGGLAYTVTDVKDLHDWMVKYFSEHPLFDPVPDDEIINDRVADKILESSEEGKKVTRNNGDKFVKVFRRVSPKFTMEEYLDKVKKFKTVYPTNLKLNTKAVNGKLVAEFINIKSDKC